MSSKFLLIFLCTFLLVQSSLGKALPSGEQTNTVETEDEAPPAGLRLLLYVLGQFAELADTTLASGKKMFQDVVTEISALESKNVEITEKLEKYRNFVNKIGQQAKTDSEEFTGRFALMLEMSDLVEGSNNTANEQVAEKLFDDTLRKHGLTDLEKEFERKFEEFSKDFIVHAETMLASKAEEEWPGKGKVREWVNEFKTEQEVGKRIEMFENFFDLFE